MINQKKRTIFFHTKVLLLKITYLKGLVQVSLCIMKSYLSSSLWVAHTFQGVYVLPSLPPLSSLLPPDLCLFLQEHSHDRAHCAGECFTLPMRIWGFWIYFFKFEALEEKTLFLFKYRLCCQTLITK